MISLEQVKLLEAKVARAVEYVEQVKAENTALVSERAELRAKLEANQKRIDELEVVVMRFKDDQGRIEDGILSALNRLNQFEEAIEKSLVDKQTAGTGKKTAAKDETAVKAPPAKATAVKIPAVKAPAKTKEPEQPNSAEMFFEIPEKNIEEDAEQMNGDSPAEGELDIF